MIDNVFSEAIPPEKASAPDAEGPDAGDDEDIGEPLHSPKSFEPTDVIIKSD